MMKILVMGSGGVGGYFGARLAQAGCEVGFVARGAHLQAMQTQGLRVASPLGDLHLPPDMPTVRVSEDPTALGTPDLVMFGVKLWDTETAARALAPALGPQTIVVSFQNGVVKDEILAGIVGRERLLGGVAYIGASIGEPGLIRHTGTMQKLAFGELDGRASSPRVEAFRQACSAAGIGLDPPGDIRTTIWEKFVFLVALSATTTAARVPIGVIRAHERPRALLRSLMLEVVAVARAEGVDIPDRFVDARMAFVDQLAPTMTSSMHHDLERGNRLELPWLSGDVVARGERLGVPTPCNRALVDVLTVHDQGRPAAG
jgi:2-dehydropantoate 2-reductase